MGTVEENDTAVLYTAEYGHTEDRCIYAVFDDREDAEAFAHHHNTVTWPGSNGSDRAVVRTLPHYPRGTWHLKKYDVTMAISQST